MKKWENVNNNNKIMKRKTKFDIHLKGVPVKITQYRAQQKARFKERMDMNLIADLLVLRLKQQTRS